MTNTCCSTDHQHHAHHQDQAASLVTDPVCQMQIEKSKAADKIDHQGTTYYFCSSHCAKKFQQSPNQYLTPQAPVESAKADHNQQIYTCPMHPEIRQVGPGNCPKCGMALEPIVASAQALPDKELKSMQKRFYVSLILTIPLFFLAMGDMIGLSLANVLPAKIALWLQFILATPVTLWGGWPFFVRGWQSVIHRHLNMFTLIAMGTGIAYIYSVFALLFPDFFPATFSDHHGNIALYFESAAVIVTLVLLGQVLELRARGKTSLALRALLELAPKTAYKIDTHGQEREIALADVKQGDHLRVKPGGRVPVDGTIIEGSSSIDESMISGEAIPVDKTTGDPVVGGTLNQSGTVLIRAEKVGQDSLLAQIVDLVGQAQRSQAPIARLADQVSAIFVPIVIIIAILSFFGWLIWGPNPAFAYAMINAIAVLIVACPCALGLATPMSVMVATGKAAQLGVLFKNAEAIERLQHIDTLVVDKTGTLTAGKPTLTHFELFDNTIDEATLFAEVAGVTVQSEHPLAKAIFEGVVRRNITPKKSERFESITGKGTRGWFDKLELTLGNLALMQMSDITITPQVHAAADTLRQSGQTIIFVGRDKKLVAIFGVSDPIKPTTSHATSQLQKAGLDVIMVTGDHPITAQAVAQKLGITKVHAGVLPQDKIAIIKQLQAQGKRVAMAGDGMNDAPALAGADVGIAMGTGTDIAMESAGVTLVKGDLLGIVRAHQLSKAMLNNIKQNLFFAFVYNVVGVVVATGILYHWTGWLLNPMIAAAAMSFSSVSVITNALRLRRWQSK